MARLLHMIHHVCSRHRDGSLVVAALAAMLVGGCVGLVGCIVSPSIEARDDPNLPPRIKPLLPDEKSSVERVTREKYNSGEVELAAELFDANNEMELHYLFLSDERGILEQLRTGGAVEEFGAEYYFGRAELSLEFPCGGEVNIPGSEVVTLYVSDRAFLATSPNPQDVLEEEGAWLVSYSWTLRYEAGLCESES
jgi:hypothetical protein